MLVWSLTCSQADTSTSLEFGVKLENFPECHTLSILAGCHSYRTKLRLYDTQQRCLELVASIQASIGGSLKVRDELCLKRTEGKLVLQNQEWQHLWK